MTDQHSQHSQQSPQQSLSPSQSQSGLGYKRASRKGAPRRYACHYEACDKVYSRQEHLQRHQLNRLWAPANMPVYLLPLSGPC